MIDQLPQESIIYYGDTARTPYGPRDQDEVRRFTLEIADLLVAEGVKMLVVACNSMSSVALDDLRARYPDTPIVEVIRPAVQAAVRTTRNGRIGVIGTELTIRSRTYDRAVAATGADVELFSAACPKFVEFAERGQDTGAELIVAQDYLTPLKDEGIDTLILGCTHYPLLRGVIQFVMTLDVVLVSSPEATTHQVFAELASNDLQHSRSLPPFYRFLASGPRDQFERVGRKFLGPEITKVEETPWS